MEFTSKVRVKGQGMNAVTHKVSAKYANTDTCDLFRVFTDNWSAFECARSRLRGIKKLRPSAPQVFPGRPSLHGGRA